MIYKKPENFTIPTTKKCSKCGIEKPLAEYYRDKSSKDKTTSNCKTCLKAYQNVYHQSEKGKAFYQSEKHKAYQKAYQKAYHKAYYQSEKHKVNRKAYNKAYYQSEKGKAFYQSEKRKAYQKAYNQRRKGKPTDKELMRQGELNVNSTQKVR